MNTFIRPRLTRSEFFDLQCRDRLTPAERILLVRAEIVDDAPVPVDETTVSLATMGPLFAAIGGAK